MERSRVEFGPRKSPSIHLFGDTRFPLVANRHSTQRSIPQPVALLRRIPDRLRVKRTLPGRQFQRRRHSRRVLLPMQRIEPRVQSL